MKLYRLATSFVACCFIFVLTGCCTQCSQFLCDGCSEVTPGAIPQPTGTHACGWQTAQANLAEQDDFVIYQYEWAGESAELSPFGRRHMDTLVHRLETQPYTVVVEPSDNEELDGERKNALSDLLLAKGLESAEARVSVGWGIAEGLSGRQAQQLERGYLNTGSGGRGFGGGLGGGGGFGAGTGGSGTGGFGGTGGGTF